MAFLGPSLRRKRVIDRPGRRVVLAAAVSLALNALVIIAVARLGGFDLAPPGTSPTRVALAPLSADQWNANRALLSGARLPAAPPPEAALPAVPPPEPPEVKQPQGQVVDVAPSPDSRPPEKSRFLSDRDNRVEKETRSRWAGTQVFERRAAAPVEGGRGKAGGQPGQGGTAREEREAKAGAGGTNGKLARQAPAPKATAPDERLAMLEPPPAQPGFGQSPAPAPGPPRAEPEEGLGKPGAPGQPQEQQRKAGDPRLLPSVESMSRIAAGPSNDYLPRDVEEGEATALNTRGFVFATFWNRFKQDVAGHWRPSIVYRERDPDGTMYGYKPEHVTELHIVLDASGALKDVRVIASSGLDFLDREAINAVRAAAPFYNVPPGLLDGKGELAFPVGFVLVMDRPVLFRPRPGGAGLP